MELFSELTTFITCFAHDSAYYIRLLLFVSIKSFFLDRFFIFMILPNAVTTTIKLGRKKEGIDHQKLVHILERSKER